MVRMRSFLLVVLVLGLAAARPARYRRQAESYVEYIPGTGLPVIISAPHGGDNAPAHIPDRTAGCYIDGACVYEHGCGVQDSSQCSVVNTKDLHTQELTREMRDLFFSLTGLYPAVVINKLHRRKFDANRDKPEATLGVPEVEDAFDLYHEYIDQAKAEIEADFGKGLFLDNHGHGHTIQWAEMGYLISGNNLNSGNLNHDTSSIRDLASTVSSTTSFEEVLRGSTSFGGYVEAEGYRTVPSPEDQGPFGNPYFSGGFLTRTHGSVSGGGIDAIQIESARSHRDLPERLNYGPALVRSVLAFLEEHYDYSFSRR